MKRLMLVIVALLALCGVARAADPNAPVIPEASGLALSVVSEGDASSTLDILVGWELKSGFEPGIGVRYLTGNPEWGPAPDVFIAFMGYHVKELGLVTDDLPDNIFEEILHTLKARPYARLGIGIPTQGEQRKAKLEYAVGTLFSNDPTFRVAFQIEYGSGPLVSEDEKAIGIGARLRF